MIVAFVSWCLPKQYRVTTCLCVKVLGEGECFLKAVVDSLDNTGLGDLLHFNVCRYTLLKMAVEEKVWMES